jgi:hypothetical protein
LTASKGIASASGDEAGIGRLVESKERHAAGAHSPIIDTSRLNFDAYTRKQLITSHTCRTELRVGLEGITRTIYIILNAVSLIKMVSAATIEANKCSGCLFLAVRNGEKALPVEEKITCLTALASNLI